MTDVMRNRSDPSGMDILTAHIGEQDGVVVVSIAGELDMLTVQKVTPLLDDAITRGKPVIVDMSALSFFSSSGLSLLARLDEQRRQERADVRLVADQRVVVRPLHLTGLHDLFPLHPRLDDALVAIGQIGRSG